MNEIVVISGKGGTGKTSITASFAFINSGKVVVADCDVDAADMHLLMQPDFNDAHDFYSGESAEIDTGLCTHCNLCLEKCRFDAIHMNGKNIFVNSLDCEGCGYCAHICPEKAIYMKDLLAGEWYISETRLGDKLVHAKLGPGGENSGKLVAKVKNEAKIIAEKNQKEYLLVDGAPGIGCPVISSIAGVDLVG